MSRLSVRALWLVAVVLLGLGGARLWRTLSDPAVMLGGRPADHWLFTGDFLFPALFWQDVADGYPVRGTAFSGATFACPELLTFGAVKAVSPRPAAAVILWHVASMGLAVGAFAVGLRAVVPPDRRPFVVPLVLLLAAGWCGWVAVHGRADPAVFELLLPMYHVGVMVNGMAVLGLLAGWLRGGGGWRLPAAGLLTAVSVLSDRLTGPWVVGPLVVALAVTRLLVPPAAGHTLPVRWRSAATLTGGLAAGTAVGLRALGWLSPADPLGNYFDGPRWAAVAERGPAVAVLLGRQLAAGNPLVAAAAGSVGVGVGVLAQAVGRRRTHGHDPSGPVFLAAFGLTAWASTLLALALGRVGGERLAATPWTDLSRYLIGPTAVGYFGWAVWLAGRRAAWAVAGLAAVGVGWAGLVPRSPTLDLLDFRPPYLEELDAACRERGLTHGLGGYWLARPATALTHAGVRMEQVNGEPAARSGLVGYPWLSHPGRYGRTPAGDPPRFQFVVARDAGDDPRYQVDVASVTARLGEPAERVLLGGCTLLVYGRPGDAALREFAAADPVAAVEGWRAGADTLTLPGWFLRPHPPGGEWVVCGPYLRLDPGRYRATVCVRGAAGERPAGWVDVVLDEPAERWLAREVPAGFAGELGGTFAVRRTGPRRMVFRAAADAGRLTLDSARLERLP